MRFHSFLMAFESAADDAEREITKLEQIPSHIFRPGRATQGRILR